MLTNFPDRQEEDTMANVQTTTAALAEANTLKWIELLILKGATLSELLEHIEERQKELSVSHNIR